MTTPLPPDAHRATLVVAEAITKLEALDAIARAVDRPIQQPRTARPFVALDGDARAEIEIPKFGEAPPLAIDVFSARSREHAESSALSLMALLAGSTSWRITPMFGR